MRILLIAPKNNYYESIPRINIFGQGLPYIAGALKQAGNQVFGVNMSYQWCGVSPKAKWEELIRQAVSEYEPQLVGVGGLSADYPFIRDAIYFVRKYAPFVPIVCGGGIVTYDREYVFETLKPNFAISGEAEKSIVQLVDYLNHECGIEAVENVAYWKDDKPVYKPINYHNLNLDRLPLPDYDVFDYAKILDRFTQTDVFYGYINQHPRVMPISLGRSCPFHCTFCIHSVGEKYRTRSIDNALNEIAVFYNKYEFNILFIYDEMFSAKRERILEFCEKVIDLKEKHRMNFVWTCDLRVNDADRIPLREMKQAGCYYIGYGFESGSQKVLNSMKKQITVDDIKRAIDLTNKAGIGVQANLILGDPVETQETIRETLEFYNEHCLDTMVYLGHIVPYPSSELFDYCIKNRIIKNKQNYYEKSNRLSLLAQYNMTKMPDKVWFDTLYKIEWHLDKCIAKVKEASIVSCEDTNVPADPDLPLPLRRSLYNIVVVCPHCQEQVSYLVPLGKDRRIIQTACMKCNRAFNITPPEMG